MFLVYLEKADSHSTRGIQLELYLHHRKALPDTLNIEGAAGKSAAENILRILIDTSNVKDG